MTYRVLGLSAEPFASLSALDDAALAAQGIRRVITPPNVGYPCRITLTDVPAGTPLLLLSYEHQPANSPYRARGPIFVSEGVTQTASTQDRLPTMLEIRPLSIRAYDAEGMMVDADVVLDGRDGDALVRRLLDNPAVDYLHIHLAKRGCYAAKVVRG